MFLYLAVKNWKRLLMIQVLSKTQFLFYNFVISYFLVLLVQTRGVKVEDMVLCGRVLMIRVGRWSVDSLFCE